MEYSEAFEVRKTATSLIKNFHEHLLNVRIEYLFVDEPIKVRGRKVAGRARKISGLNAYLATDDDDEPKEFFVMEVVKAIWDRLSPKGKKALTDHELCHFWVDMDTGKLSIKAHDVEEFHEIVDRYGAWDEELKTMGRIMERHLPFEDDADDVQATFIDKSSAAPS